MRITPTSCSWSCERRASTVLNISRRNVSAREAGAASHPAYQGLSVTWRHARCRTCRCFASPFRPLGGPVPAPPATRHTATAACSVSLLTSGPVPFSHHGCPRVLTLQSNGSRCAPPAHLGEDRVAWHLLRRRSSRSQKNRSGVGLQPLVERKRRKGTRRERSSAAIHFARPLSSK